MRDATDKPPLFARLVLAFVVLFIGCFVGWAAIARVDEIARGDGGRTCHPAEMA